MYRCFKVSIHNADLFDQPSTYIDECRSEGRSVKASLQRRIDDILDAVTNADGVVDGETLANTWFPVENTDVFLSYSHNDEDLALIITGILKKTFGLTVFMDALTWGSANTLLRNIDDRYCKKNDGTYSYKKRNFSTSHVHAMLTGAIMRAMDQAEAIFFLNTENSTYQLEGCFNTNHTLSPWIFEEIMIATMLRHRDWVEHRQLLINEMAHFQKELEIAYPICTGGFTELSFADVLLWAHAWAERQSATSPYGDLFLSKHERIKHPLNVLYELKYGVQE